MSYRTILFIASILGALCVVLGAFGAHALKDLLDAKQMETFKTAVSYHFIHSLLLIAIGIMYKLWQNALLRYAAWSCIAGIVCFSGSLYLLACKDIIGINNTTIIGPITPIGGLFFIIAWVLLAVNFAKKEIEK